MAVSEGDVNKIATAVSRKLDERLSKETVLTIVCAYCKKEMGTKPGLGVSGVTSTICPECWKELFPEAPYPEEPDNPGKKHARKRLPTRSQVRVEEWAERDRMHIGIQDKETGEYYASWWDDEAREMFEDGFFLAGRDFEMSVLGYAEDMGLLAK